MITPRLALDWTTGLAQPGVDVARAGVATFVGSNGLIQSASADTQRVDYSTGTAGLLVEESRTNRFQYTQDFSNAYWSKTGIASVDPVADIAPDGTTTANLVVLSGAPGNNQQIIRYDTLTGAYTATYYFKAAEAADVGKTLRIDTTGAGANAANLTLTASWQRIGFTHNPAGYFQVRIISSPGNTADKFLVWGAQYEAGAFRTSYIPNLATGTTTRNADVATITGTNFSDFWQASKGGVLVRARPGTVSGVRPWVQFDDNTADNIIVLRGNTTNPELYIKATTDQAAIDAGTIAANTSYRLAGTWAADNCAASLNGAAPVLDTSATIPAVTQMRIGSDGTNYLNGHIESIEYYDQRLLNASMQVVSSPAGYRSIIGPVMRDTIIR
jgi:hypothetical protein